MFSFRRRITSGPDVDVDVDVLAPADIVGQGLVLKGHVLSLVADSQPAAHSFRVIAQQGKGSYAVVYQAQEIIPLHPERARKFAIKCLSKRNLDEEARALQMAEVTIHQSLRLHPNIVTLYRTLQTPDYLLLVLEFVEGEDLFYFLEQSRDDDNDNESLSFSSTPPTPSLLSTSQPSRLLSYTRLRLIASMFAQMCDAVAACHDQNVFHRDIKPENFIVTDEPLGADRRVRVKLTDFGLSTREVECSDMDCGSAPYMSYECRNNIAPTYKPRAADVWSLGIVLINMLYHINPWTDTAHGACPSFETFRSTPTHLKFHFFMDRFPGMTKPVAEMLANRVFCILEDARDDSMRIEARELGKWVRGLPELLASAITTTTTLASSAGSPTIAGMVPLSLVLQQRHHQQHHHRRTTSTSTSPSGCPSPALSPSALPPVIQGHRLSLSMRISHRPTSRSRPASVYSSASNRNSLLIGSPALGGRLPLPMPIPLSRAPSLEPALEREEFGLGLSPSKERLVDEGGSSSTLTTTAYSNASNGTVVVPAAGVGEGEEPEGERDGLEVDAGSGRESVMNPPSTRWRKRGARGKGAQAHAQAQAAQGTQTPLQGQMMNSQGTQTPPLVGTMTGPVPPPLPSSPSSPPTGTATTTDPFQPQDTTHHTLAAASQSLASSVSKSGTGAVAATAAGGGVGVPGSVNPGPAFVPSHAVGFVSDSVLGVGSINGDLNEDVNQGPEDVGADSSAQRATSSPSIKASPLSVFASKFGGGEKERTASHAPLGTAAPVTSATTPTSLSKLTTKSSMSSTKGASSIKNASTLSLSSSQRYEPVTGPVPSAALSKPILPGGVPVLNPNLNGGESESNKIDVVAASKNETASKNAQVPVPVTKKPLKWKLSLRKSGAAAAAAAAAATIEEAKVVPPPSAPASETGSGASMTASAGGASANGPMTTAMLASLAPPPAGSLLRSSSSTSLTPTTPGGAGSASSNHQNQNAMSTTASNVTNLIMGLNPPHHHQQQHPGGGGGGGGVDHMSNHSNRSTPSVGSDSSRQGKWRRRRRSRERDGGAAIGFGTCAMGSFGVGTGTANSSTVSSVRTFGAGGQRSAGSGPLYTSPNLYVSSSLSGSALGLLPGSPTDGIATAAPRHLQQQQQQPQVYHQNPALYHLQQERERVITPTSLRGGGGAFTFGHNNGRHHTSFVHPSTSTALPFSSSSSSTSWRNSMTSTSTSTSMFSNSGTSSSTSAAASMSSPGGSTSAFTRYSNSSTRSVSTTATSVSDISWRGGVKTVNNVGGANGNGTGTGVNPPGGNSNANVSSYPNIPKNVKMIPGVPWEVDQLPRGQHMNPVGDIFGSPPTRKQRTRNKKAKQDSASGNLNGGGGGGGGSSSATAGGSLDTINEKPMSGESGTGGGSLSVSVGVGSVATWKDASTSTSDLIAREEDAAATTTTTTTTTNGGTVKKVHKGQINALAKMLSALRR